jgi:hypothetical protein
MAISNDILKGTAKGIVSTIPGGSILVSIVDEIQNGIFQNRFNEWKEAVDERLDRLEETIINKLPKNEIFATVLLLSAQLALKTNKQKTQLLANAVANSATTNLSEERVVILLNCIEKYTIPHLKLLRFLYNPKDYNLRELMMGSPMTLYDDIYPNRDKSLDSIIIRDLYTDGLINTDGLNAIMSNSGAVEKRTTALGDDMIDFFNINK